MIFNTKLTTKEIIGLLASLSATIVVIWKWVLPYLTEYFTIHFYNHSVGHRIVKDIEKRLGRDAGRVLMEFMRDNDGRHLNQGIRLNLIENNLGIGIFVCDADGKCIYANETLCGIFGLSRQAMTGFGWLNPVVNKQEAFNSWMFSVNNKIPYRNEYDIKVGDTTSRVYAEAEATKAGDEVVLGYVGIVRYV